MITLRTHRREFSNDPTVEMSTLAEKFQKVLTNIQKDLQLVQSKTNQHVRAFFTEIFPMIFEYSIYFSYKESNIGSIMILSPLTFKNESVNK